MRPTVDCGAFAFAAGTRSGDSDSMPASVSPSWARRSTSIGRISLASKRAARRQASTYRVAVSVALGAELGVRFFPGSGPRLVDRFQAPMIETFVRCLDPRWSVRLEVPVTVPARGVVDAALVDRSSPMAAATEFQSELRRIEQQVRWNAQKADGLANRLAEEASPRPGPVVSRLLVLRSTTATREIARRYEATLSAAYPARTDDVLRALTTPSGPWPGHGIVWMRVEGGAATLLHGPPRGVRLGR